MLLVSGTLLNLLLRVGSGLAILLERDDPSVTLFLVLCLEDVLVLVQPE